MVGRDGAPGLAVKCGETAGSVDSFGCLKEANVWFGSLRFPKKGKEG